MADGPLTGAERAAAEHLAGARHDPGPGDRRDRPLTEQNAGQN